jgi:ADP-ribose pyrophosphatase
VAARRELREETGVAAETWHSLGRYFLDGNRGCGAAHVFLALDARIVAAPEYEDSELITLRWFDLDELRVAWLAGAFKNIATVAAVGLALGVLAQMNGQGG